MRANKKFTKDFAIALQFCMEAAKSRSSKAPDANCFHRELEA